MGASKPIGESLKNAFGQPSGQNLPPDFLALLAELDRSHAVPVDEDTRKRR